MFSLLLKDLISDLFFLNISCKDHVTNEQVRRRIQDAIGLHNDLLTWVKKRGHISRSSGMATTILQGKGATVKEMGGQHHRMDRNGVLRFPEGCGRPGIAERYCCNVIAGTSMSRKCYHMREVKFPYMRVWMGFTD